MKINDVKLVISAVRVSQYPEDLKPEFLLVGRSNVGKSSFINTLIHRKNFARISSKPGKTRTLNFYLVNDDFYLVDVPGYGYAKASKKEIAKFGLMIEDYLKNRDRLKRVFMLVDFRHRPTDDDILMYKFLKHLEVPVTIVATKMDKIGVTKRAGYIKIIEDTLELVEGDNVVLFSSVTKDGKKELQGMIEKLIK